MGIEYYLCDDENKELFELGKGDGWNQIFPHDEEFTLSKRLNNLEEMFINYLGWEDEYAKNVFDKLVAWAGTRELRFINDVDDDEIFYNRWCYENAENRFDVDIGYYEISDTRYGTSNI